MSKISKYIFSIVLIFCVWINHMHTQNLVPNGSFEEYYDSCTNPIAFENLNTWLPKFSHGYGNSFNTFGTPDYNYTDCGPLSGNYPPNTVLSGFQYPYHQGAFIGIGIDLRPTGMEREAVRIQLSSFLEKDVCYHAEFYCNKHNNAGWVHNKLGMVFTTDSFPMKFDGSFPYPTPQVYTNEFIYDTLNWVKIEGEFTANGGEEWLTIGWMFDSTEIAYEIVPGGSGLSYSYYYIDAVRVYKCTDDEESIKLPNLITPNGDGKNDVYIIDSLPPQSQVSFFNRWGNEVYSNPNYNNEWDGTYNGHLLPTGTYFVVVQMPHGTRKSTFVELLY